MALSVFTDEAAQPGAGELAATLGRTHAHWESLVAHVEAEYTPLEKTWIFPGPNWGWSLRLKRKKRAVLYLTPCDGHFLAGFALGEKAIAAAHASGLPGPVLELIDNAPRYPEGRAVRIEVRKKTDVESVKKIAAAKMST